MSVLKNGDATPLNMENYHFNLELTWKRPEILDHPRTLSKQSPIQIVIPVKLIVCFEAKIDDAAEKITNRYASLVHAIIRIIRLCNILLKSGRGLVSIENKTKHTVISTVVNIRPLYHNRENIQMSLSWSCKRTFSVK